jgi:hypothetical protein
MQPFLNRRPIDRPELVAETLRLLTGATGRTIGVTTALHGAGGFGKTTLAALVCSRPEVRELFRGGLLWVTVGQEQHGPDLAARVNDLCEHLTGERPSFSDPEQAGHRLGQLLDDGPPTLLVVDDVWDAAQLRPFLLGGKHATRLVTTRIPGLLPDAAETVRVDQMRQIESEDLLNANVPPLPANATQKLLSLTGRWPLLLAMVNAALRRSLRDHIPLENACTSLIRQLSDQGPSSLDVSIEQRRDRAVHLTVQASLSLLPEASRQRYVELGIFGEDVDIPPDMLEALWAATGGMTPGAVASLCNDLSELSLVAIYHRDIRTIRLHDVIRLYLRHQCGEEQLAALNGLLLREARRALPGDADTPGDNHPWWLLPDQADYLWRQVCYHLAEARETGQLVSLVCDLRWVAEKSRRYDVTSVEADLHRIDDPTAAILRATLAREGHTLMPIRPGHSYPALLVSRLDGTPELAPLLAAFRVSLGTAPRLENRWPLPDRHPSVVRVLAGHDSFVTDCAIAPNGAWVVSAGSDATAHVWSTATGQTQLTLIGHRGQVLGCAVSADGLWIATAGEDGTVRVWDSSTGTQTLVVELTEPATACAISTDGDWLVGTGARGEARVWRLPSGAPGPALTGHNDRVNRCAFTRDGDWIGHLWQRRHRDDLERRDR